MRDTYCVEARSSEWDSCLAEAIARADIRPEAGILRTADTPDIQDHNQPAKSEVVAEPAVVAGVAAVVAEAQDQ